MHGIVDDESRLWTVTRSASLEDEPRQQLTF